MSRYNQKAYNKTATFGAVASNNYRSSGLQQATTGYGAAQRNSNQQTSNSTDFGARESLLLKRSFDLFDLDGSGKISGSEFRETIRCLGYTVSNQEVDALMKNYDYDGDGVMDFKEFVAMVKHLESEGFQHGKKALEQQIKHAFSVLDADGDQYLTPKELEYVLCNTGDRLSRAEFRDFLQLFDKDKDGKISCKEITDIMCNSLEEHIRKIVT